MLGDLLIRLDRRRKILLVIHLLDAVPAFAGASYVAASRLPANRHWFSDVVFGATVGIIAGRTVTSREAQPYPVRVTTVPGGAMILVAPRRFNRSGPVHRDDTVSTGAAR